MLLVANFWATTANVIWFFLALAIWIAFFMVLFSVLGDLFRSDDLGGFAKTIWVIVLLFLPFLGTLVYLLVRGSGMGERAIASARKQQAMVESYAKEVAGTGSAADQIAKAKALLDSGAITQDEFNALKAKVLG
ncbi:MAG: SHOCT domain-containing protein [Acidimicrobiia bacterium]|jgi:hypothetical protein